MAYDNCPIESWMRVLRRTILFGFLFSSSILSAQIQLNYELNPPFGDAGFEQSPELSYRWSPMWSSSLVVRTAESNETDEVGGFPGSFSYTNEESFHISFLPIVRYLTTQELDIGVGLGVGYRRYNVTELGSFELTGIQVFDNRYTVSQLGPLIGGSLEYRLRDFNVRYRVEWLPTFRTSINQDITISPLVANRGSNLDQSWGGFSVQQHFVMHFGRFFVLGFIHTWDVLSINLLRLTTNDTEYVFESMLSDVTTSSVRGTGSLRVPLGGSDLRIGGGIDTRVISDTSSGDRLSAKTRPIIVIGVSTVSQ